MTKTSMSAPGGPAAADRDGLENLDLAAMPGHLLRRAHHASVECYKRAVGAGGLRPRQFAILLTVAQNPGLRQTDLARLTGVDRSTVAELVSRLVGRGLLERTRSAADQRAYALAVTAAGRAALRSAWQGVVAAQEATLAPLAPADRAQFLRLLRHLIVAHEATE